MAERFIARKEYFGSLVFDRRTGNYIPFDSQATLIFERSLEKSLDEVYHDLKKSLSRKSFDTFIDLARGLRILNDEDRFSGTFVKAQEADNRLSAPVKIFLALTNRCNFSCRYCYKSCGSQLKNEFTTEEVLDLFDQMERLGVFELSLGGGEPLIREDFPLLLDKAAEIGFKTRISTNASLVTLPIAKLMKESGISLVKVGMMGASEKVHDYLRGDKSFRKVQQGLQNLKEAGVPFYFQVLLNRENIGELIGIIKLAEKFGAAKIEFDFIYRRGRALEAPELLTRPGEIEEIYQKIDSIKNMTRIALETPFRIPPGIKRYIFDGFGCDCGRLHLHIAANGETAPSGFLLDNYASGSLRKSGLKEIWEQGAGLVRIRDIYGPEICRKCENFQFCRGGCRSHAYLEFEDMAFPDPACPLAFHNAEYRKQFSVRG